MSSREYLDFILEQLSGLDEIRYRYMMSEYILYYKDKIFGGIYDDRFLVKDVPFVHKMMDTIHYEIPYPSAKEMILVDNVDNRDFLMDLVEGMVDELPYPKRRSVKR